MFEGQEKDSGDEKREPGFLPGNKVWRLRKQHGRKLIFETPEDLQEACFQYFDWVDDNPLWEMKVFGSGLKAKLPHPRAMTIDGLCVFLGVARMTWDNYRDRDAFKEVCDLAESIMKDQKFAGAAAGLFNAAIIARDLGLSEKVDHKQDVQITVVDTYGDENHDPPSVDAEAIPTTGL